MGETTKIAWTLAERNLVENLDFTGIEFLSNRPNPESAQEGNLSMDPKTPRKPRSELTGLWENSTKLERRIIGALFAVILPGIFVWLLFKIDGIDGRLRTVEENAGVLRGKLDGIDKQLDTIKGDLRTLIFARTAQSKAAALGFKNAHIQTISLHQGNKFNAHGELPNGQSYDFQFGILRIVGDQGEIGFDGRIGTNIFKNCKLGFRLTHDGLIPLPIPRLARGLPTFYIAILERPSPDSAIIAVGPKAGQEQRS